MDFKQIIIELTQNDEAQTIIPTYHSNANQIQILATSKNTFIQAVIPEVCENIKLPTGLTSLDMILSACMIVYHFSIQSDDESLPLFKFLSSLSKLLFQQQLQQLPTTVYASISTVVKRYLELLSKNSVESNLISQIAHQVNVDYAFDKAESSKIVAIFARDVLINYDTFLNENSTIKLIDYLSEQNEYFKLVDIISLSRFTTRFTKSEQFVAEKSFDRLMANYEIQEEDDEVMGLIQYWLQQMSTTTINLQTISIEKYFIPFVNQYQKEIEFIITGLLVNKSQFKQLGLLIFQQVIYMVVDGKFKNFSLSKFLYVIEIIIIQIMESDDQYLSCLQHIVTDILQENKSNKELFRNLTVINQITEWQAGTLATPMIASAKSPQSLRLSTSFDTQEPRINNISMINHIGQLQSIQQRAAFMYLVIYYTLTPILLYISLMKMSTHNEYVNSNIYVRRGCCEFYGLILADRSILDTMMILIGLGEGKQSQSLLNAARAHSQSQTIPQEEIIVNEKISDEDKMVILQYTQQYLQVYNDFISKLKFKNKQIHGILTQIFNKIRLLLGQETDLKDFLLNELIIRLNDESQQVKKTAIQCILTFIETDYEYINIIFGEILQVQGMDTLLIKIFEQYIIKPFYDQNNEIVQPLLNFFERCPKHLFESTFAQFIKDRNIDIQLIIRLIDSNSVGAFNVIYYFLQWSGHVGKRDLQRITDRLYVALQEYDVQNNIENGNLETDIDQIEKVQNNKQKIVWILNILTIDYIMDQLEFDLTRFLQNLQQVDIELLNKVNISVTFKDINADISEAQQQRLISTQFTFMMDQLNEFNDLKNQLLSQNLPQSQIEQVYSLQESVNQQVQQVKGFLQAGNIIFNKVSLILLKKVFSDEQKRQIYEAVKYSVGSHPAASITVLYLMYETDDIELRMHAFELLVETLYNEQYNMRLANNLLICALSAIYAFPDELAQYIPQIFDVYAVQTNFLMQRHLLQIILDLERLSLIKITPEIFSQIFMFLDSQNVDLRSLAERLLLQSSTYSTYFARYFMVCMEQFIRLQPAAANRGAVYGKVMQRLPASDKYTLLNKMLEEITKRSRQTSQSQEDHQPFLLDVFAMLAGGVVEVQINDELVKFKSSIKKMNVQYSIQQVLPRLFECLHQYNEKRAEELRDACVLAIRQVCNQMKVSFEELSAQFGDVYNLELMQIK